MNSFGSKKTSMSSFLLVLVNAFIWLWMSFTEHNFSILIAHILLLAAASTIVVALARNMFRLFIVGVLIRSMLAVVAWVTAASPSRRFDVGTNMDSSTFWDRASWGFNRLHEVHDYPLFPAINMYLYDFSAALGPPAYLAAIQVPLFAGALAGVFAYIFVKEIASQRVARTVALLFMLSPIVITFSTGLVRDTLICMFGLFALAGTLRLRKIGMMSFKFWFWAVFTPLSFVALFYLREMSFYLIVLQALLALYLLQSKSRKKVIAVLILTLGTAVTINGVGKGLLEETFGKGLAHSQLVRGIASDAGEREVRDAINGEGLTAKALSSPALLIPLAPLPYMGKLPFYNWTAPPWNPGPTAIMDVVQALGGLLNQLLLFFYMMACIRWLKTKDNFGIGMGIGFTLAMGIVMLVSFGHSRILMSHGYLFYFVGVAVALEEVNLSSSKRKSYIMFSGWVVFLFLGYLTWFLRGVGMNFFFISYAILSLLIIMTIVFHLVQGSTKSFNQIRSN
jgi:hypothetical protein